MAALPNSAELREAYADPGRLAESLTRLFGVAIKPVEVVGRPSFDFKRPELTDRPGREPSPPPDDESIKVALPRLIVALRADSEEQAREYIDAFRAKGISAGADPGSRDAGIGRLAATVRRSSARARPQTRSSTPRRWRTAAWQGSAWQGSKPISSYSTRV